MHTAQGGQQARSLSSETGSLVRIDLTTYKGLASAQSNLGVKYANGEGVPQDDAEAVRWYRVAAAQGHASAECNFGIRYANGEGVPQDHAEAVRWFRLALEDCPVFVYIYGLPVELWAQAS